MNFNTTLSAILRGRWLIDKTFAEGQMPLVFQMLRGEGPSRQSLVNEKEEEDLTPELIGSFASGKIYGTSPYSDLSSLNNDIAMVTLEGPLMKQGGMCSYGTAEQAKLINRLANANNVAGILLNIDSPGGQVDGTAMLADAIKQAAAIKPVIAHINDGMAASAAMWVASAASEIYVSQPTDMIGSIGVYTTIADWATHYKEHLKLNVQDVYAPQSTEKNKEYIDAIAGNSQDLQTSLGVIADQFIKTIEKNRAGKLKSNAWQAGKLFFAPEAINIGLIDGIKSFQEAAMRLEEMITISNQNSNTNNMAFENTLIAAGAESFAVTDNGFLLTEEQMNAVEATLTANADIVASNNTLTTELSSANDELAATILSNDTRGTRITELEAEVKALGKQPSGTGTTLHAQKDESPEKEEIPAWLDPNSAINQFADKRMKTKK